MYVYIYIYIYAQRTCIGEVQYRQKSEDKEGGQARVKVRLCRDFRALLVPSRSVHLKFALWSPTSPKIRFYHPGFLYCFCVFLSIECDEDCCAKGVSFEILVFP